MAFRQATLEDLKANYSKVRYRATDGNFYLLSQYYPLTFDVEDYPDQICLDTGGEMATCDFAVFKVEDGKLLRQDCGSKEFRAVSQSLVVEV